MGKPLCVDLPLIFKLYRISKETSGVEVQEWFGAGHAGALLLSYMKFGTFISG